MRTTLRNLDAGGTLQRAEESLRHRRAGEVEDLDLVVHWADLHGSDPRGWPASEQHPGMAKLVEVGGAGTPSVQDLAIAELAIARETHTLATRWVMADGLDLRHRLPLCDRVLHALECEVWLTRRVARATRHLSAAEAAYVDAAVAPALQGQQPARVLELLEAKVIEANPVAHEAKISAERARRYVALGRVDEAGLRHVIARVEHGDAVWVDAMVDRVADILADQDRAAGTPVREKDVLRSFAFGWLARPAELLALLLEHTGDPDSQGQAAPVHDDGAAPEYPAPGPAGSGGAAGSGADWVSGFPSRLLEALRAFDPAKLRPQATVYVHLHAAALQGHEAGGVARVENGGGPRLPKHLADLLGAAHVSIKPVIDLRDRVSINSYEMPQWLRERIRLINPIDPFPHATRASRNGDMDHVVPYRHPREGEPAPPGQTGIHNAAPLGRYHHRVKTHAHYTVREPAPGTYVWRTPHQRHYLVDDTGTHRIDEEFADALSSSSPLEAALVAMTHQHLKGHRDNLV